MEGRRGRPGTAQSRQGRRARHSLRRWDGPARGEPARPLTAEVGRVGDLAVEQTVAAGDAGVPARGGLRGAATSSWQRPQESKAEEGAGYSTRMVEEQPDATSDGLRSKPLLWILSGPE